MAGILDIDRVLIEHGARQFYPPIRGIKGAKLGKGLGRRSGGGRAASAPSAAAIRAKLREITRNPPQVMVKVTGGATHGKQLRANLAYVSRNGKLQLENERGELLEGRDELEALATEWERGGMLNPELEPGKRERRECLNVVLSMPPGTNPDQVKAAVRDFARDTFGDNHGYVMAAHVDNDNHLHRTAKTTEEPGAHPKGLNPHVHIIVQVQGKDGRRLSPRKADLQRWREGFAQALRDRGVDAAASTRPTRFKRDTPKPAPIHAIERRATRQNDPKQRANPRAEQTQDTHRIVLYRYAQMLKALQASPSQEDRDLAKELAEVMAPNYRRLSTRSAAPHHSKPSPIGNTKSYDYPNRFVYQSAYSAASGRRQRGAADGVRDVSRLAVVRDGQRSDVLLSNTARKNMGR